MGAVCCEWLSEENVCNGHRETVVYKTGGGASGTLDPWNNRIKHGNVWSRLPEWGIDLSSQGRPRWQIAACQLGRDPFSGLYTASTLLTRQAFLGPNCETIILTSIVSSISYLGSILQVGRQTLEYFDNLRLNRRVKHWIRQRPEQHCHQIIGATNRQRRQLGTVVGKGAIKGLDGNAANGVLAQTTLKMK